MAIMKPNPGCKMPTPKVPLNLTSLVAANKAEKELTQAALKAAFGAGLLSEISALAVGVISGAKKTAVAKRLATAVSSATKLAARSSALTGQLNTVSCPLPDVVDKEANPS